MSFDLIEYYKALNGESSLSNDMWHINYDKRHAFRIYSDVEGYNPSTDSMYLPPTEETIENINTFSDKSGQKINNTKIVTDANGNESVELELADRIVTIVVDQSGSMMWNDNGKFRHDIAQELVEKIDINYPGDISYNLIDYGAKLIDVLLFGIIDEGGVNPYDVNSLNAMFQADENANYDGIRVVRKETGYPTSALDGDIISDGFVGRILDDELTEGQTYYYTVYTYDNLGRFSSGINIKVTPRDRIIPRGISVFKTSVETQDLSTGEPFVGMGVNRDDNTIGIWHMDEGEGKFLYDFSDTGAILEYSKEDPTWYADRFVPAGTSGLFFNGETDCACLDSNTILTLSGEEEVTVMAWIFPYNLSSSHIIVSSTQGDFAHFYFFSDSSGRLSFWRRYEGTLYRASTDNTVLEVNRWHHICATFTTSETKIYINGDKKSVTTPTSSSVISGSTYRFTIGANRLDSIPFQTEFYGKITEVSIHNVARDSIYINSQILESNIYDNDENVVGTEPIGIREDNGDRLVVLSYEIPNDYDFVGGEVIIVKKKHRFDISDGNISDVNDRIRKYGPSWEEDGTIIYQESATPGKTFVSDSEDFALGEKYYYRIFSKNLLGNVSFLSDSPSLEVSIPNSLTSDYFLTLDSALPNPIDPITGSLITPGNEKVYLRWKQETDIDSRISRVKIYSSTFDYPDIDSDNGGNDNQLVFTGLPTDEKFVHRNLTNGVPLYYSIVNVDKYGRPSGYNPDGSRHDDLLQISTTPTAASDEVTIPLLDVDNINYEIRDDNAISIGWDQPIKSPENIEAYFDQTILVYASLTDEFGEALPEYASMKMYIDSRIVKETQADDVFDSVSLFEFKDMDAYDFFVSRTDQGFLKATLRMTTNSRIISQIKEATFIIKLKSYIPKEGGHVPPNTNNDDTNPLAEYQDLIDELTGGGDDPPEDTSGGNVFEYYSKEFTVHYTNPWEITLEPKYDSQRVYERCYYQKKGGGLGIDHEMFYGIHMRASSPFVARAKVTYRGEPVENTSIQIAVWDADSSKLCASAGGESRSPFGYQGEKLHPSQTVLPPDVNIAVLQGTEQIPGPDGNLIDSPISYVDIPLYAPDSMQAVRLFVKGEKAGYSSIKDMYVLFQSILRTEITASTPTEDGKDVREQQLQAYVIHPDYPDQIDPYSHSLSTPVADFTIVQWGLALLQGENVRSIYSIDNVPISNGVYSYTRNGHARNVFFGPIHIEGDSFEETHELSATVVYKGMTSEAKSYMDLSYDPTESSIFGARFLMEVDGGWRDNGTYGGGGWLYPDDSGNPLWSDGISYKKMKIHRNPAGDPEFAASYAFNDCAAIDSQIFELNSGQIVEVNAGDDNIEILHGEITEEIDPYTGMHYLSVGKKGEIHNGSAFIELEDEEDSDVTYFYIRANAFIPGSGGIQYNPFPDDDPINDCLKLNPSRGLYLKDLPKWDPYFTISGKTTLFVNDKPLVLRGGGNFYTGIPPCPICLNEPLIVYTKWRKVTNYFYSEDLGDPSNEYLYPVTVEAQNNHFTGINSSSLINNQSDVDIRVKITWRGDPLPDGTPVYTSIGDNSARTVFFSHQNIYYTQIDEDEGYSYVDVRVSARRIPTNSMTEKLEIYTVYDENEKTERRANQIFNLSIDINHIIIVPPIIEPDDPSVESEPPIVSPFTGKVERYDILSNEWSFVSRMSEGKGDLFHGEVNGKIYVMGGLLNNSLNISSKNEEYDVATDTWSFKTIMPTPRFGGMSVTVGNDIYTIGGIFTDNSIGGNLSVSNVVEVYHTDSDEWEVMEYDYMPIEGEGGAFEERIGVCFGTAQHATIGGDNYIYVFSGIQDLTVSTESATIDKMNERILRYHVEGVEGDRWEWSDVLRSNELDTYRRISPLSLTYDDKIIVFNGAIPLSNSFDYTPDDFYIDIEAVFLNTPKSDEWIYFGSGLLNGFPVSKFQSAMARYDENPSVDTISEYYILGGGNSESSSLDLLENLSAVVSGFDYISSYDQTSFSLSPLITERHGPVAEYSDASGSPAIYLMGGYTTAQDSNFIDIGIDI